MRTKEDASGGERPASRRVVEGRADGRPKYVIVAPEDLSATELDVGGETFVLFEWSSARVAFEGLTRAERDVVSGILRGESNGDIGKRRGTRARTIANQVAGIFRKLGVQSRAELVARLSRPERAL